MRLGFLVWFLVGHALEAAGAGEVLTGRVVSTDGRPIAGATVSAYAREQTEEAAGRRAEGRPRAPLAAVRTGADGTFRMETAAPAVWVEARAEGRVPTMAAPAAEGPTTLTLSSAALRRGVVRGGGRPLGGALVVWTGEGGSELFVRTATDGSYEVPDPGQAPAHLAIYHPDFAVSWSSAAGHGADSLDRDVENGISIVGSVVDGSGRPVPNATLWLDGRLPAGRSDAAGAFNVAHAPERWQFLSARSPALAGVVVRRTGRIVVTVRPVVTLTGSVRDAATGQPLARATVVAAPAGRDGNVSADTDARGNYTFAALLPDRYRLYAGRPGYVSGPSDYATAEPLDLRSAAASRRDFALRALPRVRGRVVDAEQRPVDGALVALGTKSTPNLYGRWGWDPFGDEGVRTGPDGAFTLVLPDPEAAAEDEPFERDRPLVVLKEGYAAAQVEASKLSGGSLVVVLTRGVELSGLVAGPDGTPLAGVAVTAAEDGAFGGTILPTYVLLASDEKGDGWTSTDANGRFSMRVHPVVHHLSFRKAGYAPKLVRGHDARHGEPLAVALEPAAVVRGRVSRADGRGVPEVDLALVDRASIGGRSAQTDADGSFVIGDLAPGAYQLTATHSELGIQETVAVEAPSSDLQIVLAPRGTVRGRVLEAATQRPVTRFTVALVPRDDASRGSRSLRVEDAGGVFSVEDVPLGTATLTVTAEGYATRQLEDVVVTGEPETPEVEVALDAEAVLAGRVTAERGGPVPQAQVTVEGGPADGAKATSDADGEYELRGLAAGEIAVTVEAAGFLTEKGTVDARLRGRLDFVLRRGLALRGEVVAEGGGVARAQVAARSSARGAVHQSAQTDEQGRFVLEGLVPGRYTVRAVARGMREAEAEDVDVEQAGSLRLVMERAPTAVLSGKVVGLPVGEGAAIAMVVASSQEGGASAEAMIAAAGTFRMEEAPAGRVEVRAISATPASTLRSSRPLDLTLAPGSETEVVLEFASDVVVRGVVVKAGRPVPGAMVSFARAGRGGFEAMGFTDATGAYEVAGLDPGAHEVRVSGNGISFSMSYTVSGSAELDIDVTGGTVSGRVVRADTGAPVTAAEVLLFRLGERETAPTASVTTGVQGAFSQGSLVEGQYRLVASKAGFGQEQREVEVARGSTAEVTFELQPAEGVSVSVVDARDGRPLEATVVVRDEARRIVANRHSGVGEDGTLNVPLASGSYLLSTSASGYGTATLRVTAPSRGLRVGLTPGGTLRFESPRDLRGRVRLVQPDGEEYVRCWCNGIADIELSGRATTVANVTPGTYTVELIDVQGSPPAMPVTVREGQVTTLAIE